MTADEELLDALNAALRLGDPIIPLVGTLVQIADREHDPSVLRVYELGGDARDGLRAPLRRVSIGVTVERGGGVRSGLRRWYHFPLPFVVLELPPNAPPLEDWLRFGGEDQGSGAPLLFESESVAAEVASAFEAGEEVSARRMNLAFGPGKS